MKKVLIVLSLFLAFACQNTKTNENQAKLETSEIVEVKFQVKGMTCTNCEQSVTKGVNELEGIEFVKASFADSVTVVRFDKSKTTESEITEKIKKRGYEVKGKL